MGITIETFNQWLPLLSILAVFFLFLGQYRLGKGQSNNDLILLLQNRDKAQTTLIADYQKKFEEVNREIGLLKGQIIEKDKKLEEYMLVFQGRNPEQKKFMEFVTQVASESAKYMKESAIILKEVRDFMQKLNMRIEENTKITKHIDNKRG